MFRSSRTSSPLAAGGAAACGVVALAAGAFLLVEARIDASPAEIRNAAPSARVLRTEQPASDRGAVDAAARHKLADLLAQRVADAACTGFAYPQRAC
jgi:hypothetical protein